jgi:regulator of replication initiation timing
MKTKIEKRLVQLKDQKKDLESQVLENGILDSEYHRLIRRLSTIKNEYDVLKELYVSKFSDIAIFEEIEDKKSYPEAKIKGMKEKETETKIRIVMGINDDKVSLRRKIDKLLNHRTDLIKRFIKDVYGADVDLDSLKINIQTGQYGL